VTHPRGRVLAGAASTATRLHGFGHRDDQIWGSPAPVGRGAWAVVIEANREQVRLGRHILRLRPEAERRSRRATKSRDIPGMEMTQAGQTSRPVIRQIQKIDSSPARRRSDAMWIPHAARNVDPSRTKFWTLSCTPARTSQSARARSARRSPTPAWIWRQRPGGDHRRMTPAMPQVTGRSTKQRTCP
jgi:hypothetical protein